MIDKLLIVGGTGFIGSHLANRAVNDGFKTYVLSLNLPSKSKQIESVEYFKADISNLNQLKQNLTITEFDFIVNLSGYVNHSDYLDGGKSVILSHFIGVQNLLEVIEWSSLKRFVQIGSSDEYGNHDAPQSEKMLPRPFSPYSFAKASSSALLQMLYLSNNFPAVILRLFLVYGPNQNKSRFLPQIIKGCLDGKSFPVSPGNQLRDFCYVDDIVNGILMTFQKNKVNGEVINLASGKPRSIKNVIKTVQEIIDNGDPRFNKVKYRVNENMNLYADIEKAKEIIDWKPNMPFLEGIRKTINFYNQ
jgi:nucleoside-diphosphate-sugar epimerase